MIGAYEGGGYLEKGIFRGWPECMMKALTDFCPVCQRANAMSTSSFSSKESDESNEYDMSEDEFTFINPSNVYKFQDAFDNDNDYMAYAS